MDSSAKILGNLGLRGDQQVPSDVHEFVKDLQIILQTLVILNDKGCALLRRDALVRIV
jgi:hypothetical protein